MSIYIYKRILLSISLIVTSLLIGVISMSATATVPEGSTASNPLLWFWADPGTEHEDGSVEYWNKILECYNKDVTGVVSDSTPEIHYIPEKGTEMKCYATGQYVDNIQQGSAQELHIILDNCPQKISTQEMCDILAEDNNAETLTFRVYDGYDSQRIQNTLGTWLSDETPQDWIEEGEVVGKQYTDLTAVVISPTDGHFRNEFGSYVRDDGRTIETLPQPQTAREKSADPKTKIDWGREASEFFVDFYDENNDLVSTKTYYVLSGDDENLQGDTLPPVVRDPVKTIDQPEQTAPTQTTQANTEKEDSKNTKNSKDEDTEDKTTGSQNTEDQQGTVQTSTQTTEPQVVSPTDTTPTPLFYYFPGHNTMLMCYAIGTTGVPTDSNPLFYYLPDQQSMMQCYSIGSAISV